MYILISTEDSYFSQSIFTWSTVQRGVAIIAASIPPTRSFCLKVGARIRSIFQSGQMDESTSDYHKCFPSIKRHIHLLPNFFPGPFSRSEVSMGETLNGNRGATADLTYATRDKAHSTRRGRALPLYQMTPGVQRCGILETTDIDVSGGLKQERYGARESDLSQPQGRLSGAVTV